MLKAVKFGGSSLADAQRFAKVRDIVLSDASRRVVVVSAPGKRFGGDYKITDLLYLCYAHIKYGVDYGNVLNIIKERYSQISEDLGLAFDAEDAFREIEARLKEGAGEEYLVSRGEALCSELMAEYLGFDRIEPLGTVFLNYDSSVNTEKTYSALKSAFENSSGRVVLPGFYGTGPDGSVALMPRGGSDITGAIAAAALSADMYENWTDVPGILMADPAIVDEPYTIPRITYNELRELTYVGAKVLHEASVLPVRRADIPLNIRDTNNPSHPGTLISERFDEGDMDRDKFYVTGIAGRKGYCIVDIMQYDASRKMGALGGVLKIFERHGAVLEHILSGVDSYSLIVPTEVIKSDRYVILSEIKELCGEESVKLTEGISLIACVSRNMAFRPGISGRIFGALGENNINIRMISQGAEELNIIIGIDDSDYARCIRVLYDSFTRKE